MKIIRNSVLWFCLVPLLSACGNDDDELSKQETPLALVALIGDDQEEADTWADMLDRRVAVEMGGEVKRYMVNARGNLRCADPFMASPASTVSLTAWYPYNNGIKPATRVVKANQNILSEYQASNLMEAVETPVTNGEATLRFLHLTSKLVCDLSTPASEPVTKAGGETSSSIDFTGAQLTLLNLQGVEYGTSVRMSHHHKAYMLEQVIPVGTEFLEVKLQDGRSFTYVTQEEFNPKEAIQYDLKVEIDPVTANVSLTISQSPTWEGDKEDIPVDVPGTDTNGSGNGWNGGNNEDDDGSSEGTETNGSGNGWNGGNNEDADGSTTGTDPNGSGNGWNGGDNEDADGTTTGTDSEGQGGTWNGGNEENADGTTPGTSPTVPDGTWNGGNNEDADATTPGTSPTVPNGGSGWNGSDEETDGTSPGTSPTVPNGGSQWTENKEELDGTAKITSGSSFTTPAAKKEITKTIKKKTIK